MLSKIVAVLALVGTVIAQATVQTPAAIVQCQPVAITFTGGQAPYFLSIIPGGQTAAPALVDFGQVQSSPYTWNVNIAAGQSITIKIVDSAGVTSYSAPVTILNGSSDACLTASTTSQASASTPEVTSTSTSAGVAATTSGTTTTSASNGSATSRATSAASSATSAASSAVTSATPTSASGAQPTGVIQAGAALVVGILGGAAALL